MTGTDVALGYTRQLMVDVLDSRSSAALKNSPKLPWVRKLVRQELTSSHVRLQLDEPAARSARFGAGHEHGERIPGEQRAGLRGAVWLQGTVDGVLDLVYIAVRVKLVWPRETSSLRGR